MKRASLFLFTCFTSVAFAASPAQLAEWQSPIEQVFEAPGHSQEHIYRSAKMWIAQTFRSAKAVIEYDNEAEGTLIGNGLIAYPCKGALDCLGKPDWKVSFTLKIDTKTDRFRTTFSNVKITWPASVHNGIASPAREVPISSKKDREKISAALLALGSDIQKSLANPAFNDDW